MRERKRERVKAPKLRTTIGGVGFCLKYFMEMMEMVLEMMNGAKIYIHINICILMFMFLIYIACVVKDEIINQLLDLIF